MLEIAICDDEKKLRTDLRHVIEKELALDGVEFGLSEYESGEALLRGIRERNADIIFLDIEMGGMNGMEAARTLRKNGQPAVIIFVTSYPDFVFHGYEVKALNYILKPYQEKKIKEVLQDALKELEISTEKYFTVEQKSGTLRLALRQIRYFVSEGRKITAAVEGEEISFYGKLGEVEEELPDFFVRCHNRYLVNLNYVTKLESAALYCGGEKIPVSRSCSQETAAAFARFMLK